MPWIYPEGGKPYYMSDESFNNHKKKFNNFMKYMDKADYRYY